MAKVKSTYGAGYGAVSIGLGMSEALRSHFNKKLAVEQNLAKQQLIRDRTNLQGEQMEQDFELKSKDLARREEALRASQEQFKAQMKAQEDRDKETAQYRTDTLEQDKQQAIDRNKAEERRQKERLQRLDAQVEADKRRYDAGVQRYESQIKRDAAKSKRAIGEVYTSVYQRAMRDFRASIPAYVNPSKEQEEAWAAEADKFARESVKRELGAHNEAYSEISGENITGATKQLTIDDVVGGVNAEDLDPAIIDKNIDFYGNMPEEDRIALLESIASDDGTNESVQDALPGLMNLVEIFPELGQAIEQRSENIERKRNSLGSMASEAAFGGLMGTGAKLAAGYYKGQGGIFADRMKERYGTEEGDEQTFGAPMLGP